KSHHVKTEKSCPLIKRGFNPGAGKPGGDESWAAQDLEVEGVGILDQFWQAFHVAGCHSSG
ncbi:MAG: hypothetical protein V3R42_01045, partial [candidate division NC10 bacterium]